MTEMLFNVGIKHRETGEKIRLNVWAECNSAATSKLLGSVIGPDNQYIWTGTSPVYKNNEIVKRYVDV